MPVFRLCGGTRRDFFLIKENASLFRLVEAGDRPEQRRLAAAAWAEEEKDLAGLDPQVDPLQRDRVAEALGEIFDRQRNHAAREHY
jgi:hypothetical protein